jgi:OOP family OmpA-OmpF porin
MISKAKAGLGVVALASAVAFAGPAFAQDTGFYVGGALGQSSADVDCTGTISCDDKDNSWKILVGYQFNRNFSLEFGYADLGAATATTPPIPFPPFGTIPGANLKIETTTWELVGVGSVPIADRFSIYGKVGLYRADTETRAVFTDGVSGSESDSSTSLTFGLGLRYDFTQNLGVRAEWQRYGDVSEAASGEEFDIDVISIGVIFRF